MGRRLTLKDMQKIAKSKGGKCISKRFVNTRKKLKWECKKGHVWRSIHTHIKRGSWCPFCWRDKKRAKEREARKLVLEKARNIAQKRRGKCLSKEYLNCLNKLKFRCKEGHIWETTSFHIRMGCWCPKCFRIRNGLALKLTIQEMKEVARKRGGECLSKNYTNSWTKLRWRCRKGHEWEAAPNTVKNGGTWCPYCAGHMKLTIEDMRELADSREGKCLSAKYINSLAKLRWRCAEGHVWEAIPSNVMKGSWCPYCARKKTAKKKMRTRQAGR